MTRMTGSVLAAVLVMGAAGPAAAQQTAPAHAETLVQTTQSWNGHVYKAYPAGQPQLTILKVTIAARTRLPWHTHPIPNAGYVLSGELTIEDKASGKTHTFRPGEAFGESVDDLHRGMAGDQPVTVLAFYAGAEGVPLSKPLKGGEKEY